MLPGIDAREVPVVQRATEMRAPLNVVAAVGLALGAVFGLAGTLVAQPNFRNISWGIDSLGLVMAATLLSLKFFRKGNDFVAAGFLVFAIGEAVMLSGTTAGLVGSVPAFAAGTALWATSLLLISIPREFSILVRLVGIASSILFAITATRIFWVNNCCQPHRHCRSSPTLSSSLPSRGLPEGRGFSPAGIAALALCWSRAPRSPAGAGLRGARDTGIIRKAL